MDTVFIYSIQERWLIILRGYLGIIHLLLPSIALYAQQQTQLPPLEMLRANEDYSVFWDQDFQPKNLIEQLKFIPLSENSKAYLSIGGEVRYQYEYFKNNNWGAGIQDDSGWWLQRYMLHTDIHLGRFRLFTQLQSGLLLFSAPGPRGIDKDELDLHQVFAEYYIPLKDGKRIYARLGRQEFWYGARRLISVREGPNLRQSFDAGKLVFEGKKLKLDAFYGNFIDNEFYFFDNRRLQDERLWGIYTTAKNILTFPFHADLYYIGFESPFRAYAEGQISQTRHSLGIRLWRNKGRFQFNNEFIYQFGQSSVGDIQAFTLSLDLGYKFPDNSLLSKIGLKTEIISGDKALGDGQLNSFNSLYPRGAYFGLIALIGPSNLLDFHPSVILQLSPTLGFTFDWDIFWRLQLADGIYGPNATLERAGNQSNRRYLGHQPGFELAYEPDRHWQFAVEGSWFLTGEFFTETGADRNVVHFVATTRYKF